MDYKFKTTFWNDFTIADAGGVKGIEYTYKKAFGEWKSNYIYLTELVLVLNWKLWDHYNNGNETIARLYNDLWEKTHDYALDNLKGEELSYYIRTVD